MNAPKLTALKRDCALRSLDVIDLMELPATAQRKAMRKALSKPSRTAQPKA